ncbi:MAG TPA: DUF4412 domain-containing protein [Labilithrix sp.]|nr:DUF4412 domain-containing protein [Labilithrix sp.]
MARRITAARRKLGTMIALGSCLAGCNHLRAKDTATDAGVIEIADGTARGLPSATTSLAVAETPPFPFDVPFEGDVTMTVSSAGRPSVLVFEVKGANLRVSTGESYAIADSEAGTTVDVSTAKKTATLMRGTWPSALLLSVLTPGLGMVIPVAMGKASFVGNYPCAVYQFTEEGGSRGEACMVRGTPFFRGDGGSRTSSSGRDGGTTHSLAALGASNLFSMRTVRMDATGKETSRVEVTRVEQKRLDDALFVVPPGYKTVIQSETGWQR